MANRYGYQFNAGFKPKMVNIEGFVSIGTGGLPNSAIPFNTATGNGVTSTYWGTLPGYATAGAPTGWQGTFSGAIGLYGAGVAGIARVSTGLYSVMLSDNYVRLDSVQVMPVGGATAENNGGATGVLGIDANVPYYTVGQGNTVTTGAISQSASGPNTVGMSGLVGQNLQNQILIQFSQSQGGASGASSNVAVDLPLSSGFFIALRLRDSLAGVQ